MSYIVKSCIESFTIQNIYLTEINYVLSVNAQGGLSRVRLTQEISAVSTGRINGTVTLLKDQQMCINTTAILEVSINILPYSGKIDGH